MVPFVGYCVIILMFWLVFAVLCCLLWVKLLGLVWLHLKVARFAW